MPLAPAGTADPPVAVLTGPTAVIEAGPQVIRLPRQADICGMVPVGLDDRPVTAAAALVWNADLCRPLQQILFDTADAISGPEPAAVG